MKINNILLILLVFFVVFIYGCKNSPNKISIGIIPARDPVTMKDNFEPIRSYLEKEMGVPVEVVVPENYYGLIESMKEKKVDIGFYGPFSYIMAEKQIDLEPMLLADRSDSGASYQSLIIARKDSGIKTLDDLQGKKFNFVDPGSTSGFVIPYALFKSRNIDIHSYFRKTDYSHSHDGVVMDVLDKKVDAGAVADMNLKRVLAKVGISRDQITVVWNSDPIPGSPIVARADLPNDLKENFRQAMLSIHKKDPRAIQSFDQTILKYVNADSGLYDGVRNISNILGEEFLTDNFLKSNN